jgi:hypothetical protein
MITFWPRLPYHPYSDNNTKNGTVLSKIILRKTEVVRKAFVVILRIKRINMSDAELNQQTAGYLQGSGTTVFERQIMYFQYCWGANIAVFCIENVDFAWQSFACFFHKPPVICKRREIFA